MMAKLQLPCQKIVFTALIFLLPAIASRSNAATLADYRARVSPAATALQQLQTADYYADDVSNTLTRVRTLLPARETVLFNQQNVEVDNSWLHEALTQYEKNQNNRSLSTEQLRLTVERLRA